MCDTVDCRSPGEFHPVIVLRENKTDAGLRCVMPALKICLVCKYKTNRDNMIGDEEWETIVKNMVGQGFPPPTREFTTISFCGLKSKEAKAAHARGATFYLDGTEPKDLVVP